MFPVIFLLFSFLEVYSLIWLGGQIGGAWAFCWVLCSAAIGIFAIRTQHAYTANAIVRELNQGGTPQISLVDAVMIFVGGILLVLPGLFSDLLGFLLLMPFTRFLFRSGASRFMQQQAAKVQSGNGRSFFFTMNSRTFGNGPFQRSGPSPFDAPQGQGFGPGEVGNGFASGNFPYGGSSLPPRQTEAVIIDAEVAPIAEGDSALEGTAADNPRGGAGNNSGSQ